MRNVKPYQVEAKQEGANSRNEQNVHEIAGEIGKERWRGHGGRCVVKCSAYQGQILSQSKLSTRSVVVLSAYQPTRLSPPDIPGVRHHDMKCRQGGVLRMPLYLFEKGCYRRGGPGLLCAVLRLHRQLQKADCAKCELGISKWKGQDEVIQRWAFGGRR